MKPSFEKTVDVLVKAYLNDTLQHGNCAACAVGNMVADALNCKVSYDEGDFIWIRNKAEVQPIWDDVFVTSGDYHRRSPENYTGWPKRQIDATGYTWQELARIEYAFEVSDRGGSNDEWMFNGLMAVLDVLADIHKVDLTTKESAKLLFVKA